MSDLKSFIAMAQRAEEITRLMTAAMSAPENARKEMDGAILGHKKWDGYGLREIASKDLHKRAVSAVTDYLINDLAERKRVELRTLAHELDSIRCKLAVDAQKLRFLLLDNVVSARSWKGEA